MKFVKALYQETMTDEVFTWDASSNNRFTGIGIPKEIQERLFDSFEQGDPTLTRKYGGTGLGLTIARELVQMVGGTIGVDSEPGTGATFWFTVPFEIGSAASNPEDLTTCDLQGLSVPIVDGNVNSREALVTYAKSWGMSTVIADCGIDAQSCLVDRCRAPGPFDLAIVDMDLPDITGTAFVNNLRSNPSYDSLAVIGLDSSPDFLSREHLAETGKTIVLRKPVRRAELHMLAAQLITGAPGGDAGQQPRVVAAAEPGATMGARILVAEDNEVNQEIARENLTAHAMSGDRETCFASGMDDFLTKPFSPVRLREVLDKWLRAQPGRSQGIEPRAGTRPGTRRPEPARKPSPRTDSPRVIDRSAIQQLEKLRRDGAPDPVKRVVDRFLGATPGELRALQAAGAAGDMDLLRQIAHKLKSSSASLGANRLSDLRRELETNEAIAEISDVQTRIADVEKEFELVSSALKDELSQIG